MPAPFPCYRPYVPPRFLSCTKSLQTTATFLALKNTESQPWVLPRDTRTHGMAWQISNGTAFFCDLRTDDALPEKQGSFIKSFKIQSEPKRHLYTRKRLLGRIACPQKYMCLLHPIRSNQTIYKKTNRQTPSPLIELQALSGKQRSSLPRPGRTETAATILKGHNNHGSVCAEDAMRQRADPSSRKAKAAKLKLFPSPPSSNEK